MKRLLSCLSLLVFVFGVFCVVHAGNDDILDIDSKKFKIVFVGDTNVGKTSIFRRMLGLGFQDGIDATIGASFKNNILLEHSGEEFKCEIVDTAGMERYRSLVPHYFKNADVAILVCSIDEEESINSIHTWVDLLQTYLSQNTDVILVGNKIDKAKNEEDLDEFKEELRRKCENLNLRYDIMTSAKSGANIGDLMHAIGGCLYDMKSNHIYQGVNIEAPSTDKKGNCCKK